MSFIRDLSSRKRLVAILACSVVLIVLFMDRQLQMTNISMSKTTVMTTRIKHDTGFHKLVHLDLKGAPPLFSYLIELLPLFRQLGATGLLVEYEDMFPYEGVLRKVPKSYAYTSEQIKTFLAKAKENNLEVIPLVQTLGHLEFVLKSWRFLHLREVYNDDRSICPSNNKAVDILQAMIDNVLSLHTDARWIHLGGDEVANLGKCSKCLASTKAGTSIFADHMVRMMNHVIKRSRGQVRPIIWDDMVRHWTLKDLQGIAALGDIMSWDYGHKLSDAIPDSTLNNYAKAFDSIWVASAFKGAQTEEADSVNTKSRVKNNRNWKMKVSQLLSAGGRVRGVALAGWSRYSHHRGLCELLPSGIPSLALCLDEWNHMDNATPSSGFQEETKGLDVVPISFPGSDVYDLMTQMERMHESQQSLIGAFDCYSGRVVSSNCKRMDVSLSSLLTTAEQERHRFEALYRTADAVLNKYYHVSTVTEWIEAKISPRFLRHISTVEMLEVLRNKRSPW